MKRSTVFALVALLAALPTPAGAEPAQRSFTYQALVNDNGAPANGTYDVRATLFDDSRWGRRSRRWA